MTPDQHWHDVCKAVLTDTQFRYIQAQVKKRANGEVHKAAPRPHSHQVLLLRASQVTGQPIDALMSRRRDQATVRARWAAWRWLHEDQGLAKAAIARLWNMDHTSVVHALRKMDNRTVKSYSS